MSKNKYAHELAKGSIEVITLRFLMESGEVYGYQVAEQIREMSQSSISVSTSTVYQAIQRMLRKGWIQQGRSANTTRRRKYYRLTKNGRKVATDYLLEAREVMHAMERILFAGIQQ